MRELEKRTGAPLLHHTSGGVRLTDAGSTVYDYTRRIFSLADEMHDAVREMQGLRRGWLTIGSSTTPGEYVLPWAIGEFQKRHPDIEVSLRISNTQGVIEQIRSRELDLGMAGSPVSIDGLESFEYVSDDIVIIAAPDHKLARRKRVTLVDLGGQRFILREPGSATRSTAEGCLEQYGVEVKVVMELGSNEAVKRAVAAGLGIVSRFGAAPDVIAGFIEVLPVEGWTCRRPLTVFYRRDRHLPAAQRAFLEFLRTERPLPPMDP